MERIGLYPGTFDPMTNGHLDIIQRGAKLVDRLVIGVAINDGKGPLFSLEERTEMVLAETKELSGTGGRGVIEAVPFTGLLMHFAEEMGASVIIRGLRAVADFEYEFQMAAMNQKLSSKVETVFLMAEPSKQAIASRLVKEIAQLDGKVSDFLPPRIEKRLLEKVRNG
ncbi:MAG: pantetheine-phosphate adenylyltransferase [Alphaproteobacteria bacterium]